LEWRLGDSLGISVIDKKTLERGEAAHRTPQEALLCAKAKRQQQNTQPERKSTPRFGDNGQHFIFTESKV